MMTETEFARIVHDTKGVVLSAIEKHLAARHYHAIDDVVQVVDRRTDKKYSSKPAILKLLQGLR